MPYSLACVSHVELIGMVSEQLVIDTVKRMLESGIDESAILATLKDIGMDEASSRAIIAKVKAPTPSAAPIAQQVPQMPTRAPTQYEQVQAQMQPTLDDDASSQEIEVMRNELETQAQTAEMNDATTHNVLSMHEQKLDDVNLKLDEVRNTLVNAPSAIDSSVAVRLAEIEKKLDEVSAQTTAALDVLKKILETDRKILTDLEASK